MARILAIDYGGKRTGLAVTDTDQIIATPLGYQSTSQLFDFLDEYFAKEDVEKVVIGYPLREDGSPTDATRLVEQFISKFKKLYADKPIILQDEANTSRQARSAMVMSGTRKKKRQQKGNTDAIAATLILQSYMEEI